MPAHIFQGVLLTSAPGRPCILPTGTMFSKPGEHCRQPPHMLLLRFPWPRRTVLQPYHDPPSSSRTLYRLFPPNLFPRVEQQVRGTSPRPTSPSFCHEKLPLSCRRHGFLSRNDVRPNPYDCAPTPHNALSGPPVNSFSSTHRNFNTRRSPSPRRRSISSMLRQPQPAPKEN